MQNTQTLQVTHKAIKWDDREGTQGKASGNECKMYFYVLSNEHVDGRHSFWIIITSNPFGWAKNFYVFKIGTQINWFTIQNGRDKILRCPMFDMTNFGKVILQICLYKLMIFFFEVSWHPCIDFCVCWLLSLCSCFSCLCFEWFFWKAYILHSI